MKKFIALIGSFALLSACTFTVTTEMNKDDESDDTVPAEETVEEGAMEEAPIEDDGTVEGSTNEDAGGDGTNTVGGGAAESEASSEASSETSSAFSEDLSE